MKMLPLIRHVLRAITVGQCGSGFSTCTNSLNRQQLLVNGLLGGTQSSLAEAGVTQTSASLNKDLEEVALTW